jgi:D,D-heptose 1,7-bisphosphate phosphatase
MNKKGSDKCTVAILAGGLGTRLKSRTGTLPKPMALIHGKPVLEHLIDLCRNFGHRNIVLLTGYGCESIIRHFGDGSAFGVSLFYSVETEPRGTAGALFDALPYLEDCFFVLYGDTYADVNLNAMRNWHENENSQVTLLLHPNDHPEDSDLVSVNAEQFITAIHPYPRSVTEYLRNLVNAALYIFQKDTIAPVLEKIGKADIAKHALPLLLLNGARVKGYVSPEYVKDMGTPDRLDKVREHILMGLPERLSMRGKRMAVFLDRDGTINEEVGHLHCSKKLRLIPGAAEAIRQLNSHGILAVLVTNQPVIARGELDYDGLNQIHAKLETLLGAEGAYLDAIYFCPHHTDRGFPGERTELKTACNCRKPEIGMILAAQNQFNIDLSQSWMIGDSSSDILAAERANINSILVNTGNHGKDGKYNVSPKLVMPNIKQAVTHIISTNFSFYTGLQQDDF